MKILSVTLNGYHGFQLRQIKHFHYTPSQKTQIILGTNGSGKSRLLRELSPLPAIHTDYDKGGSKIIEIEHHGKVYRLSSLFTEDGNRYPFELEGENLNPGGTITVHRELVKQHFGYTPEIHALLTGATTFHAMSVSERRSWFTRISDTDYTYALRYYQRLSEQVRDLQGALKRSQERFTAETSKCLTPEAETHLRQTVSELTLTLNRLLEHRQPRTGVNLIDRLPAIDMALRSDMARLEQLLQDNEGNGLLLHPEGLEAARNAVQSDIKMKRNEISIRCETIEKHRKEIAAAKSTSKHSLTEIEENKRNLTESIEELYRRLHLNLHFEDVQNAWSAFDYVRMTLAPLIEEWLTCPRLNLTQDSYNRLIQQRVPLEQQLLKLKAEEEKVFAKKREYEVAQAKDQVECPACHHSWHVNFNALDYKHHCQRHEELTRLLTQVTETSRKNEEEIAEHVKLFGIQRQYAQLVDFTPILAPLWTYLGHACQGDDRHKTPSILNTVANDLGIQLKIESLSKQLKEFEKEEALMKNSAHIDIGKLEGIIAQEETVINGIQENVRQLLSTEQLLTSTLSIRNMMTSLESSIWTQMNDRTQAYKAAVKDQVSRSMDELIQSIRLQVSQHEQALSRVDIQKGIVKSLEIQIKEIEAELALLKLAQKALSPVEGLIAKGMTNFINHFVGELNAFISKIWLYPLELIPLSISDGDVDLDYRFSVKVNNDHTTPDVSKTSGGMQEVIDLAFVATSMRYLGFSDFPVFLDEFAIKLDVAHRQSAYHAINYLIDSTDYSQVFLVSHYQEGYGSLGNSEVLVLCNSNIELPDNLAYNKHVTMQ